MSTFKRFLSLVVVLVMVIGMVPATVFATEEEAPACEHAYVDGVCTECGEAEPAPEADPELEDEIPVEDETPSEGEEQGEPEALAETPTPITGTITEDMTWNDGDVVGDVTISGNVTITVNGTVTVAGTIRMNPDAICSVTFVGENNAMLIRSGDFTGQMFYVEGVSGNFQNLTFNNITLDGGAVWEGEVDKTLNRGTTNSGVKATGSVLYLVYANADLNNSTLQNHDDSTGDKANAVFLRYYSTIDFNNSVVRNNNSQSGSWRGGVVTVRQGGTCVTNSADVYGNSAASGGFFGIGSSGSFGGIAEAYNSKFHNNYAGNGAVFLMQCNSKIGYLKIDGCEFYDNASKSAVLTEWAYSRPFIISNSYFHDNECAVWDCHTDPVLDLSGKIVIAEDPDYAKYLYETPIVLTGALAEGSSIAMSEASLTKLGGCVIAGSKSYDATAADLAKFVLPAGYAILEKEVDVTNDGVGDTVASKDAGKEITLTLKDSLDSAASAEGVAYSKVTCLPVNPFAHDGLIFAGWVDAQEKVVAKKLFTEATTLSATWKIETPVVTMGRTDAADPYCNTLKVTVTNLYDGITYTYQWYKNDVAIEGATAAEYTITETATYKCVITASREGVASVTASKSGSATFKEHFVAKVGDTSYGTLKAAVEAANAIEGGAIVTLLDDVDATETIAVTGNVTIEGEHTINRVTSFTGTLFTVAAGATLTLDGGLVVDGGNEWTYKEINGEKAYIYEAKNYANNKGYDKLDEFVTAKEGIPVTTADMIAVSGALVINNVTLKNHWGKDGANVIDIAANGELTMNAGAVITHNVTDGQGVAVKMNKDSQFVMNGGEISGNAGRHHGGGAVSVHGGYFTMAGGKISDNFSVDGMGVAVYLYDTRDHSLITEPTFLMTGGEICSNVCLPGTSANRNGTTIYARNGIMLMEGGSICHNYGRNYSGAGAAYATMTITGGNILDNQNINGNSDKTEHDYSGNPDSITGGIYSQDVTAYLAPGYALFINEDGYYEATNQIYKLWFRDPVTHEQLPYIGPLVGNDAAELVEIGKGFYANYYEMELEVLHNAKFDKTVVIDYPMTINLNGKTITNYGDVYPMIRVQGGATVIVQDGTIKNEDYVFVLGASDGSSAGNLVINSGSYVGETTIASVTKGKLTILGGEFSISENETYDYAYLLNCVDANFKDRSAKIFVQGGTFVGFNPADNKAEGEHTNFLADGYCVKVDGDKYIVGTHNLVAGTPVAPTFDAAGYTVYTCAHCGATENRDEVPALIAVAQVGETKYVTLEEAIDAANAGADKTIILLTTIVIDKDTSYDFSGLNVKTIATEDGVEMDAFKILANVTITANGGKIDARPSKGYTFYVGDKDGTVGNLTINSGTCYGDTSVAQVTKGKLTINGGNFSATPYQDSYTYTLNCIDANFKDGTAVIEVKGGCFYKYDPANNAAEGEGTDFVAEGYKSEELTLSYFTVLKEENQTYVAEVNGTQYTTLQAAVNAAKDGDTVKVIADHAIDPMTENNNGLIYLQGTDKANLTIDLNGHDITVDTAANTSGRIWSVFYIRYGATVTFTGGGSVTVVGDDTNRPYLFWSSASKIIMAEDAGVFTMDNSKTAGASMGAVSHTFYASSAGNVTINGGTYYNNGPHDILNLRDGSGSSFNINGGFYDEDLLAGQEGSKLIIKEGCTIVKVNDTLWGVDAAVARIDKAIFGSLEAAFKAVNAEEKIVLLENVAENVSLDKSIELDLNGKSYTGTITLTDAAAELTAVDGLNVTTNVEGKKVVYEDGVYKLIEDATKVTVTVQGATMVAGNAVPTEFTYTTDVEVPALDITYTVDGTTINATVAEMDGYAFKVVPGTLTVLEAVAKAAVNKVTTYFASLQEAYDKADSRVDMLTDIVLTETLKVTRPKTMSIYTNGKNLSGDLATLIEVDCTSGGLTISSSGKITNTGDVFFVNKGNVTIYGACEITSEESNCIYVRGGKTTIQKAKLIANGAYPAIQGNGNYAGDVTISGGSISAPNAAIAIYWPQNGTLSISGGTITGETAVYAKSGKINISGGEFIANGDKVDFQHYSNGAYATGDAVVIEACKDTAYETPKVTISGGTFTSAHAEAVMFYNCNENADAVEIMEISGGTFSTRPSSTWCAEGYLPVFADKKNTTTWTVKQVTAVAAIGDEKYAKVQHAVNDAVKGDEIDLIADVENQPIYVSTEITLDLNGHTYVQSLNKQTVVYNKNGGQVYLDVNSANGDNKGMINVMGGGLTVMDSVGTGKIESTVGNVFAVSKALTIENGVFKAGTIAKTGEAASIVVTKNKYTYGTALNIVNGEFYTAEGGQPFKLGFVMGNKTDAVSIEKAWFSESIQETWIDAKNAKGFSYVQSEAKSSENVDGYLVTKGLLTVDDVWFGSWDDAESSIKKNSTIVLYDDVVNYYGGTVAKDFKFPANGGNITLNLNGHTFTSAKSKNSAVTSVSVQYGTTLNIIGSGKIVIENNSYPFVINPRSTVKIAEGIDFVGTMQWNVNGDNSGDLIVVGENKAEKTLVGVNGIYKPTAATRIVRSEAGDWTLSMGSLQMTKADATLAENTLTINKGCSVDIAGNDLTAKNVTVFGTLIDTTDGTGSVVSGNLWFNGHDNSGYMPLKDGDVYRLFAMKILNRGAKKVNDDKIKYGFTIKFTNKDAYLVLINNVQDIDLTGTVNWLEDGVENEQVYVFEADLISSHAQKVYDQLAAGKSVTYAYTLNVSGVSKLTTGTELLGHSTMESVKDSSKDVVIESKSATYTKP